MDSEELYYTLRNKEPNQFRQTLTQFLDETSDEDIQEYNTFDDVDNFSQIWVLIKQYDLGDLAVKFIKKLMLIKKEDPQKNKFMIGFANNSENTIINLKYLKKYDQTLPKTILDTYTTPERKQLFESRFKYTGALGGKRNNSKKKTKKIKKKKTKKRTSRRRMTK